MDLVNLTVNTQNKEFMFNLGRLFALGATIKIENIDEVNKKIEEEKSLGYSKSFNMMIKYWQDNLLCPNISSESFNKNGVFIICPVRNATSLEKKIINAYVNNFEKNGSIVHYPQRDTNQNPIIDGVNTGGYNICLVNATAIMKNKITAIYYNKYSVGSMFDLGVAYELIKNDTTRRFKILNFKLELNKTDFIDNKILELFELDKKRNPALEDLFDEICTRLQ